jgi:4-hydroxy-tetrahydrodipicolinate synthase
MTSSRLTGVIAAAATPIREDRSIDLEKLVAHCRRLLDNGCDGINLLGTTGEATSFSVEQRLEAMAAVARSGLPLDRFMVGTGAAALADAIRLTAAARDHGFAGALLLPPFYYKGIDRDGLVGYVEAVIAGAGPNGLRLYLYHFPQLSGVPYTADVVEHLRRAHPGQVLGLKDSSGDLDYSADLARRLPGFAVFPSSEASLGRADELGFAGCISATVNVNAPLAGRAWRERRTKAGSAALEAAGAVREALGKVPLVAAVKWALATLSGDDGWRRLVPPLRLLLPAEQQTLERALAETAFAELNWVRQ